MQVLLTERLCELAQVKAEGAPGSVLGVAVSLGTCSELITTETKGTKEFQGELWSSLKLRAANSPLEANRNAPGENTYSAGIRE